MRSRTVVAGALAAVLLIGVAGYSAYRVWRHFQVAAPLAAPKTSVVLTAPTASPTAEPSAAPTPIPTLPPSVFIKVPFTSQFTTPAEVDDAAHQEYCEAAALLMVADYFKGDTRARIPGVEADTGMAQIYSVKRQTYPASQDLPLSVIGSIGAQMFGLKPTVVPVGLEQIQRSLAAGRPVIIPVLTHVNGVKIAPNYGNKPVYHVILITGYDAAKNLLYTNDAGFQQGQNWAYQWSTLSHAVDAQALQYPQGRVMLVFERAS